MSKLIMLNIATQCMLKINVHEILKNVNRVTKNKPKIKEMQKEKKINNMKNKTEKTPAWADPALPTRQTGIVGCKLSATIGYRSVLRS